MKPASSEPRALYLWAASCLIAISGLLLGACGSSATTTLGPSLVKCATTSASAGDMVPAGGGTGALTVTALPECTWTASTKAPWIAELSPASGQGNGQIQFKALANPSPSGRDAELLLNDQVVRVQQAAAACLFTVTPGVAEIGAGGGTFRFVVTTLPGCAWSVSASASWITVVGSNARSGPATIDVLIADNTGDARSATVVVANQVIPVTQPAASPAPPTAPCTYTAMPITNTIGAGGGTLIIALETQAGCPWSVSAGSPWLEVAGASSGVGSTTVTLVAAGNAGGQRVATVTVAGQPIELTQTGTPLAPVCTFAISPGSATLAAPAATVVEVAVSAGTSCPWTSVNTTPWITVQSGHVGSGNGVVALAIAENVTPSLRSAVVTIAGQPFGISQGGLCSFSVGPTSASLAGGGGAGPSIAVGATAGCGWSASSNVAWLTVTSGTSGSGNGAVTFSAAVNTGATRTGTLTVAGQTVSVTQSGGCSLSVAPTTTSVTSSGATGQTVAVSGATGCQWSSTSNAAWLTITNGTSGSGNGTVTFTAAPNAGAARQGTLTIAAQTVTVTQAGGCSIALAPASASLPATAGPGPSVAVTTAPTCAWAAVPSAGWITVTPPGGSGTGNGSFGFSVAANSGPARSGAITVSGATFPISQASGCSYTLAPATQSIGSGGGAATPIGVTAATACTWTATTTATWLTISPGSVSGSGNGTVAVTAAANTGPARSGTIAIGNQTATISQAGGCSFTVDPTDFVRSGDQHIGLTITVAAGSGCSWTATTEDGWITLTAGAAGTGNGTVRFTLSENTGGTRRGSITVAGTVVQIRQNTR